MTPPASPASEPASQIEYQDQQRDENPDRDTSLPPVIDAPPLAPSEHSPTPAEDIESVAARRAQRQAAHRRRWERSMWMSGILTLVALNLMLIGWRSDVVRWLPQTASLYAAIGLPVNLRGLIFTDVTTERETQSGVEVLVVQGTIVNNFKRPVEVPRLRFSVRYESGYEVYSWTALPNRNVLLPGESLPFSSRLASPPREGDRVQVRFFNRRDLSAELP
jgi:cation transport ATPase